MYEISYVDCGGEGGGGVMRYGEPGLHNQCLCVRFVTNSFAF